MVVGGGVFVRLVVAGGVYGWPLLGLWWPKDIVRFVVGFFFCFLFYVAPNTVKYSEKKPFSLKLFTFENILHWEYFTMKRSL